MFQKNIHVLKSFRNIFILLLTFCSLAACEEKQRDRNGVLSEKAMVDVLYDYQLAMALASENAHDGNLAELEYRYAQGVFKKHKISEGTFRISVAHYARDPKQMLAITNKVSERLTGEIKESAGKSGDGRFDGMRTDTIVLWENRNGCVLTANYNNHVSYNIPAGSLKPCERLLLGFEPMWIYREGAKSGGVIFTVKFDNDSVANRSETLREYGQSQGVSIDVPEGRHVKSVNVSIYQSARWQKYPQVLSLTNFSLWGIKTTKPDETPQPTDSTSANSTTANSATPNSATPNSASAERPVPGAAPANRSLAPDTTARTAADTTKPRHSR